MTLEEKYDNYKKQGLINYFDNNFNDQYYKKDLPKLDDNIRLSVAFCTPNICANCKGRCCQSYPCAFSPNDFLNINDIDYMRNILDLGLICIALTENKFREEYWYLRPMGIMDCLKPSIVNTDYYTKGYCILKDSKVGCMLSAEYRPREGLIYYPIPDKKNESLPGHYLDHMNWYTDEHKYKEWKEYQKILQTLAREYINKETVNDNDDEDFDQMVIKLTKRIAGYKN